MSQEALELNGRIMACTSWRQLTTLMEGNAAQMQGWHTVAMLSKLCKLSKPTSPDDQKDYEDLVARLFGLIMQQGDSMRPSSAAQCIYSVGRLEYYNADVVSCMLQVVQTNLSNLFPYDVANVLWSLAKMGVSPGEKFFALFEQYTVKRLAEYRPVELLNVVNGLVTLGHRPGEAWLKEFLAAVLVQGRGFGVQEFCRMLYAIANLGYAPPPDWLAKIEYLSFPRFPDMRCTDLVRLSTAVSQFEFRPGQDWQTGFWFTVSKQIRYMQPADMSSIMYSMAYLGLAPPRDVLDKLWPMGLRNLLPQFNGDELASVLAAVASFSYWPGNRDLDDTLIRMKELVPTCSYDGLARAVNAMQSLPPTPRTKEILTAATTRMEELSAGVSAAQQPQEHDAATASGEAPATYDQAAYDQAAYDQAAYDQAAYNQAAYNTANAPAYDQAAYDAAAYAAATGAEAAGAYAAAAGGYEAGIYAAPAGQEAAAGLGQQQVAPASV